MKKAEFLQEVQAELDTIKTRATKKEIARLNFDNFNHESIRGCIYGQMTGGCNSERALQLQGKKYDEIKMDGELFSKEEPISFSKQDFKKGDYFTSLEKYLYMVEAPQHDKVIQYLKGEVSTIKL